MCDNFIGKMEELSRKSGYDYDFLVGVYDEIMSNDGDVDWKHFIGVTMEHDW